MFMERPAGCSWNSWPDAVEYALYHSASGDRWLLVRDNTGAGGL